MKLQVFMKKRLGNKYLIFAVVLAALAWAGGKLFLDSVYVPVIVMYHSVGEKGATALDGYGEKLNVTPVAFARQMKFLHDGGYKVIPLADFVKKIKRNERIPHKTIAITFDDGLKNNFLHAYPVLKKYDFPAIIFVPTDFIGRRGFLAWDDIKAMQKNNISIGSHTLSHKWLPDLDNAGVERELLESRQILEENSGQGIRLLSYPLGGFTGLVKKIAKETGYAGAVATNPGKKHPSNDPYALKRIRISETSNNLFVFRIETSGYYTFIKEMRDSD